MDHSDDKLDISSISISGNFGDYDAPAYRSIEAHPHMDLHAHNTFSTFNQPEVYRSIDAGSSFDEYSSSSSYEPDTSLSQFGSKDQFRAFGAHHQHHQQLDQDDLAAVGHTRTTIEPPEVPGGYLEPAYHFMTSSRPNTVFSTLVAYFHQHHIDFTLKHDKFKIKCVSYQHGSRLPFIVRIFSVDPTSSSSSYDNSKQYAVEFQRRSGDIIQFSSIYRGCKTHLEQEGYTAITSSKHSVQLVTPPPLDVHVTVDQARDTMKCLVQMASSDCADVKSKAIDALTEITREQDEKIQQMMVTDGGLDMLLECLDSTYEDVHRSAISGVANLTKERASACQHVVESLPLLYKLATSETLQTVREVARALDNIGVALGKDVVDLRYRQTLDVLSYSKDPVAQSHAHHVIQILGL